MMTEWDSLYLFWALFFLPLFSRGGRVGSDYRGILGWIGIKSSDTEYIGIDEPIEFVGNALFIPFFSDRGRNAG